MKQNFLKPLLQLMQDHSLTVSLQEFLATLATLLNDPLIYLVGRKHKLIAEFGDEQQLALFQQIALDSPGSFEHSNSEQIPIRAGSKKLATLVVSQETPFTTEQQIVLDCAAMLIGLILSEQASEESDSRDYQKKMANLAISSLTHSELVIIKEIVSQLEEESSTPLPEGLLVASRIADDLKMARSVVVNALKKLQSAGVIESRSLGMKGTRIRIINHYFLDAIQGISLPFSA